jgi:hypothetical protein
MKKSIFTILFLFLVSFCFAQGWLQDVVYLKNGSIIRGVIMEQIPNKTIKLQTADNNVFVYQMDEIEKITKEAGKTGNKSNDLSFTSGYKGMIDMGYSIGVGDWGMNRFRLTITNGYQFNPFFYLGFATGIRYFENNDIAIPLLIAFRVNVLNQKNTPYIALNGGYAYSFEYDGSIVIHPEVGMSFKLARKSDLHVGIGFDLQDVAFRIPDINGYYSQYETYEKSGAISLSVGISF